MEWRSRAVPRFPESLKEKEEKDFKSRFARKAKSDLRACLDLKASEKPNGGALHAAL